LIEHDGTYHAVLFFLQIFSHVSISNPLRSVFSVCFL
jgi:hypothetical protein